MIVSCDLDCSNTLYIQFSLKFITKGHMSQSHLAVAGFMISSLFFAIICSVCLSRCPRAFPFHPPSVLCEWRDQLADVG